MAVPSVFISSVVGGLEDVRAQAAVGVERVGMHPILSERLSADAAAPRRALLDEVAGADIYLLLLGARYGEAGPGGRSPTEDEYDEAVRLNKPILALVQEVELDPAQGGFLERIRGSWGEGVLYGRFGGADDAGAAVAAALARHQVGIVENSPAAQARALELARGEGRRDMMSSGVAARVAFVPLRQTALLDAVTLEVPALGDDLASAMRHAGLVPQRIGMTAQVSGAGVRLEGNDTEDWTRPAAVVGADGAITVVGSVATGGSFGFSLVDPDKLGALVRNAGRFAQLAWDNIDTRGEVSRAALTAAIPEAQYKGFGAAAGNTMGISMSLPPVVLAPEPPEVVARGQLGDDAVARRVVAAVRRAFADAGALQS